MCLASDGWLRPVPPEGAGVADRGGGGGAGRGPVGGWAGGIYGKAGG